jgi:hypothetical protein
MSVRNGFYCGDEVATRKLMSKANGFYSNYDAIKLMNKRMGFIATMML